MNLLNIDNDLFEKAAKIKTQYVKNIVYFRGLIEYSNMCSKNCYYCGIRKDNKNILRYTMTDDEVIAAAEYAYQQGYGSIVLQGGEIESPVFTKKITSLLHKIMEVSNGKLGVTLSLGEQERSVLKEWQQAGARRYLLRIETSNKNLYSKIHPNDSKHSYDRRVETLDTLKFLGYQVGTGVMIGLPFQTLDDLENDLIFFKDKDIDMFGMGPYIEHSDTPLFQYQYNMMFSLQERFNITLNMIANLRIMMPNVNIAATTAMQAIDPCGREKALQAGANIIMPNITPKKYRDKYLLYQNKPCLDEEREQCKSCLEMRIKLIGENIGYGQCGDSLHFTRLTSL
ncbi:[FeFe] hydrogenase maturase subunit HydE [Bacteroidia bacterium]|nr:[FeFe] hydrogenase maturase subunit HydE [Bacteroidia bacterium]